MGGNYNFYDSKKVNLVRYKSTQKDHIAIGEGNTLPNNDSYKNISDLDFNSTDDYLLKEERVVSTSKKELETSFIKIGNQIARIVAAILPITLFLMFFNQLRNGFFENSIHISSSTLSIIAFYFLFFAISIAWLSKKKKIKLSIKSGYLHLSSFPTFHQKFNLDTVNSCYVNAFNHPSDQFDYLTSEIEGNLGQFSVNLESGIAILLNNGKKILIGTSNSVNYYQRAYLQ